jgi:hypothetical protein
MAGPKANKAEYAKRIDAVLRIVLLGGQFHDIKQYAQEDDPHSGRPWNVTESQLFRYQNAALKLIAKRVLKDSDKLFARAVARYDTLYARAVEAGDLANARGILKDQCALLGLFPAKPQQPQAAPPVNVNIFQRVSELEQQIRIADVDGGPPAGRLPNHDHREQMAAPPANGEASQLPPAG